MPQIYLCVNKPLIDFNWIESRRHAEQIIADLFCARWYTRWWIHTPHREETKRDADEIPLNLSIDRELENRTMPLQMPAHKAHIQSWPQTIAFPSHFDRLVLIPFPVRSSLAFLNRFDTAKNFQYYACMRVNELDFRTWAVNFGHIVECVDIKFFCYNLARTLFEYTIYPHHHKNQFINRRECFSGKRVLISLAKQNNTQQRERMKKNHFFCSFWFGVLFIDFTKSMYENDFN